MTPIAAALSLFFLLALVASSPDPVPHFGDCVPKSCGDVSDITYPFWVSGRQPDYCGLPEFELKCKDDTLSLQTPNGDVYHVRNIYYANQSVHVALSYTDNCPIYRNLTFASTPFDISLTNWELLLIYDCPKPQLPLDLYAIFCGVNESFSLPYYNYGFTVSFALPAPCEVAVLPLLGFPGTSPSDYAMLISDGFLLNWTEAGCSDCKGKGVDCSDCQGSGGDCGYDSTKKSFICICEEGIQDRSCTKKKGKAMKIAIGVGVGGGLLAVFFVCLWCNRGKIMRQRSSSSKFLIHTESSSHKVDQEMGTNSYRTHVFSYAELHEATNGFDESRELGDGGFGTVYKGNLRDGRVVAVKRLYENNFKRVEQFLNEVDILSRLRHPNLVTLYGCTSRHSRELLLVYEFVPNGTVADHLHGPRMPDNGLTWPIRLSIAIETAEALAYLHAAETQIIHRDVKTTNILLDSNFHVKVADFGLSRLFPLDATHVSTLPQGTPGYVDPEYHQCYQLTDKSDVYSFGVVLVELISSMPAVDISRHRHEINLANLAINRIQNREVEQLVDPRLVDGDWEIQRMTNMVAEVAFRCLQAEKEMRPSIKEVLEELRRIQGGGEKAVEPAEIGDDARLLKNEVPFSPDTVTERWESRKTTPNTSA